MRNELTTTNGPPCYNKLIASYLASSNSRQHGYG